MHFPIQSIAFHSGRISRHVAISDEQSVLVPPFGWLRLFEPAHLGAGGEAITQKYRRESSKRFNWNRSGTEKFFHIRKKGLFSV